MRVIFCGCLSCGNSTYDTGNKRIHDTSTVAVSGMKIDSSGLMPWDVRGGAGFGERGG